MSPVESRASGPCQRSRRRDPTLCPLTSTISRTVPSAERTRFEFLYSSQRSAQPHWLVCHLWHLTCCFSGGGDILRSRTFAPLLTRKPSWWALHNATAMAVQYSYAAAGRSPVNNASELRRFPRRQRSRWSQFRRQRLDGPRGTAAAKEVMVARQDRNVESEGKCDRCPIVGVSGHPSARRTLHVFIERPGYDLDRTCLPGLVAAGAEHPPLG
jgi:hypothetical protein